MPGAGAGAIVLLVALAVAIALPVWTYNDAVVNSSNSAFLWALVVFLAPVLGIVLYLLIGRDGGSVGRYA